MPLVNIGKTLYLFCQRSCWASHWLQVEGAMSEHSVAGEDMLDRIVRLEAKVDALTEALAAGRGALRMLLLLGSAITAVLALAASAKALLH